MKGKDAPLTVLGIIPLIVSLAMSFGTSQALLSDRSLKYYARNHDQNLVLTDCKFATKTMTANTIIDRSPLEGIRCG